MTETHAWLALCAVVLIMVALGIWVMRRGE